MGQDPKEIVIAAGGDIFTGPVGTEFPDEPTADVDPAFVDLGLVSEDGAKFNYNISVAGIKSWQRRLETRRTVTDEEMLAGFALQQWNAENWALGFGGGEFVEDKPGIYRYDFPNGEDAINERALLLRWADGDKHYQLGIDRGNVTDGVEVGLTRSKEALIPIAFKALAGVEEDTVGVSFITDDEAFEPVGS